MINVISDATLNYGQQSPSDTPWCCCNICCTPVPYSPKRREETELTASIHAWLKRCWRDYTSSSTGLRRDARRWVWTRICRVDRNLASWAANNAPPSALQHIKWLSPCQVAQARRGPAESRQVVDIEFYYIWREHANLCSVKQLKPKTWRISDESSRHLTPSHAI